MRRSADMKYYTRPKTALPAHRRIVSRTGYTGEDGCEIDRAGRRGADDLGDAARSRRSDRRHGRRPGLPRHAAARSRDAALRPRADRSRSIRYQAGLDFAVESRRPRVSRPRRAGAAASRRHVATAASAWNSTASACRAKATRCLPATSQIGEVTSGTFSPTLDRPIAMAYVEPDVRSRRHRARRSTSAARNEPAHVVDAAVLSSQANRTDLNSRPSPHKEIAP